MWRSLTACGQLEVAHGSASQCVVPSADSLGRVTAILILVLIYRSMLGNREEDQIFLDSAAQSMANEQREIVSRIEKLSRPITALLVASGVLLVTVPGYGSGKAFRLFSSFQLTWLLTRLLTWGG